MTNIAVVADDLARIANMLPVMTTKTTIEIKMPDVVRVSLPVCLHFREEIGLKDPVEFSRRRFDNVDFAGVNVRILLHVKLIEA